MKKNLEELDVDAYVNVEADDEELEESEDSEELYEYQDDDTGYSDEEDVWEEDSKEEITTYTSVTYTSLFNHDEPISHEKTCQMYDEYKAGKITDTEWVEYICQVIEFYLITLIKPYVHNNHQEFEDLRSEAYLAVIERAKDYNPYLSKPTCFFTGNIHSALKLYLIDEAGTTHHYDTNRHTMEKKLRALGYSGVDDPRLTFAKIVHLTGMPQRTVQEVLDRNNVAICSLDKYTDNHDVHSPFMGPEEYVEKKEEIALAKEAFRKLNDLEKWILVHSPGIADITKELKKASKNSKRKENDADFCPYEERVGDHELTMKQMANYLKSEEGKKRFGNLIPKSVNGLVVQQILQGALTKLRLDRSVRQFYDDESKRLPFTEQCSEDDLLHAFVENELSFA